MTQTSSVIPDTASAEELALGTDPIPAGPYFEDSWFRDEVEAIFKRTWINIGHRCELPEKGSYIVRELEFANVSLLIVKGTDDCIRAFHNVCPHRGTQLISDVKAGRASAFSCPYHRWTFNHDGSLRAAPDFQRFYIDKSQCSLSEVAIGEAAGMLYVNIDPQPKQSLADFLGPLQHQMEETIIARADNFSEYVYDIAANWKVTYDNFQENYHLTFVHTRSGGATSGAENPFGYPLAYGFHEPHRTQTIWTNADYQPSDTMMTAFATLGRKAAQAGFTNASGTKQYFAVFPSLFMFGSLMQPFTHQVYPISATRSRGVIRIYWIGEDDSASLRFSREYAMASARDIHAEDFSIIEAGQRGLNSGAITHIHFQQQEVLCRHLFEQVRSRVDAYRSQLIATDAVGTELGS